MSTNKENIFTGALVPKSGENFDTLLSHEKVLIQRIVSSKRIDQQVMLQEEDEWCIMIAGSATILIDGKKRVLHNGDYCFIPAHTPHQLLEVEEGTLWLAVHIQKDAR